MIHTLSACIRSAFQTRRNDHRSRSGVLYPGLVVAGLLILALYPIPSPAQSSQPGTAADASASLTAEGSLIPDLNRLASRTESSLAPVVERFTSDRRALLRRYDASGSPQRRQRLTDFYMGWRTALAALDFDGLEREAKVDWILLNDLIDARLPELEREQSQFAQMHKLLPFADTIFELHEQRRQRLDLDPSTAAQQLADLSKALEETRAALARGVKLAKEEKEEGKEGKEKKSKGRDKPQKRTPAQPTTKNNQKRADRTKQDKAEAGKPKEPILRPSRVVTHRATNWTERVRKLAKTWYDYRAGYDPLFTWWVKQPYQAFDKELQDYKKFLETAVLGIKEPDPKAIAKEDPPIIGDPIGRDALLTYLRQALIAYTPEELIAIAERDLEWGENEMRVAAREMGFTVTPGGERDQDWQQALEKVKSLHAAPGGQPSLVRDLAYGAIEFVEEGDLVTIPPLAKEVWRIEMMSPERQKTSPFFLGGEVIWVSFPTDTMTNQQKQMSLRGNNIHFSRATVQHELIPGHHLQGFMTSRYNPHRRVFNTPFWGEGWALYWELRLWDMGFARSPEDRVGMLFWRLHRDARVIWSLKFHLGEMSPQDCVDFLVNRIGHEKENALAEVRRSLEGNYSPIYQLAYLMGGFQFRALQQELVGSGRMTDKAFHDAVLQGGPMPIEMVRARLSGTELTREFEPTWRFADELSSAGLPAKD